MRCRELLTALAPRWRAAQTDRAPAETWRAALRAAAAARSAALRAPAAHGTLAIGLGLLLLCTAAGARAEERPKVLEQVGLEQNLDQQIPLDLPFRNESGEAVHLRDYFGAKPVIVNLVYYECPMLCTLVLNGLVSSLRAMSLDVGKDFEVVTVSFDPRETPELAAKKKQTYLDEYRRPGAAAGWHFLTGDQDSIRRLAEAVGFRYAYDDQSQQFAHAAGIMVATPQGRLSRYFYGVEYSPRDLRLGLVEASQNRIGSVVDQILLFCFHYDPLTGRYSALTMNAVRAGGVVTVLAFASFVIVMLRREKKGAGGQGPGAGRTQKKILGDSEPPLTGPRPPIPSPRS